MKRLIPLYLAAALAPAMAFGQVIVNDSWTDAGRNNGADSEDTDWWYSTSSSAIEVGAGYLGLVTGGSGRGIHGTFTPQALAVGDTLIATATFTTPATVTPGSATSAQLRVGMFDTTGNPSLAADISASSGTPNAVYNNLSGYMMDLDVNSTGTRDVNLRERTAPGSGQLLAATTDYTSLGNGGVGGYTFAASTSYSIVYSIARTASSIDLTGSLFQGVTLLTTHTVSDLTPTATTFGMLAFQVGSSTFGSSSAINTADNGIDFTNIKIEYIAAVPEPSVLVLSAAGLFFLGFMRRGNFGSK